jgi:hypothetical protein
MSLREIYKGHDIVVSAVQSLDSGQWQPRFFVVDLSDVNPVDITYKQSPAHSPCEAEAERETLLFAKKWIDDGKPPL